jgi:hypothetical protein
MIYELRIFFKLVPELLFTSAQIMNQDILFVVSFVLAVL